MRIYMDSRCCNRLFDDPSQERVREEALAVQVILEQVLAGELTLISGDFLQLELQRGRDLNRRLSCLAFLRQAEIHVRQSDELLQCAKRLEPLGSKEMDVAHVAGAAVGAANIFLTVDDELLRKGRRILQIVGVPIAPPFRWLREMRQGGEP